LFVAKTKTLPGLVSPAFLRASKTAISRLYDISFA